MYSPVRRCQKNELSDRLEMPTAQPNKANTAENTAPSPSPGRRAVSIGGGAVGGGATAAVDAPTVDRESVGAALMLPALGDFVAGPHCSTRGNRSLLAGIPGSRPLRSWSQSARWIWM